MRQCPVCGKVYHYLGYARHAAMHRDKFTSLQITYQRIHYLQKLLEKAEVILKKHTDPDDDYKLSDGDLSLIASELGVMGDFINRKFRLSLTNQTND